MNKTISVIVPAYNNALTLDLAIESVVAQSYKNWELIIVDDGSTDKTKELAMSYAELHPNIRFYEREREPKGGSTCRNIGAELATGEYLIFLDADDILLPHCIERRTEVANSNPMALFIVFPTGVFPNGEMDIFHRECVNPENYLYRFITSETLWQTTGPMWNKEFFFQVGGFDENYKRLQDPEFTIRALLLAKGQFCDCLDFAPDYQYRIQPKNTNIHFLRMMNDVCNLHYTKLLSINCESLDKRKAEVAITIFLIVHYDWLQQLKDKQLIKEHLIKVAQHISKSIRPIHIVLLKLFNRLGYSVTRLLIGYLRARCYDIIDDRKAVLAHRYFIVWVIARIKSKVT